MVLSAIAVVAGSFWLAQKRGVPAKKIVLILLVMLVAAFVGARILNILVDWELYFANPQRIFALGFSGFSLFGGGLLAASAGFFLAKRLQVDPWQLGDAVAPFLGLGIALMRLGCFLNGCCFGKITDRPWGVRFPALSSAHISQLSHGQTGLLTVQPVHPTQIYELVGALIASAIAVYILQKKYRAGTAILAFIIFFTAVRWINYAFFRVMPDTFDASPFFYPLLYAGIIAVSLVLLVKRNRRYGF